MKHLANIYKTFHNLLQVLTSSTVDCWPKEKKKGGQKVSSQTITTGI